MRIKIKPLNMLIIEIFNKAGCHKNEAIKIAKYLIEANLTGHDSHGVIRTIRYISGLENNTIKANVKPILETDSANYCVIDGDGGFGQIVGPYACKLGIKKAKKFGNSIIAIKNSSHLGRIGDFAEIAAENNIISIHFVNSNGLGILVAPFGSYQQRFSTNPFAAGVPIKNKKPFILDFATSYVSEGKIYVANQGGKSLPPGSLVDEEGKDSSDPFVISGTRNPVPKVRKGKGAIKAMGDHKGSGLAFLCEFLAGALTGSGMTMNGKKAFRNGMFSIYIDPSSLTNQKNYEKEISEYIKFFKSAAPINKNSEVLVPGEPENKNRKERRKNGIPLTKITWNALKEIAEKLNINPEFIQNCQK